MSSWQLLPAALGLLAVHALLGACGEPAELAPELSATAATGIAGAPSADGGGGGQGGDTAEGGGGADVSTGGAAPTVLVGVLANAVRADVQPPSRVAEIEAAASAYAAGARVAAVKRRWADADPATLAEDAQLARAGCPGAEPCRPVALTLAVVDGALDGRPVAAGGAWSASATRDALDATLDDVFDAFGDELVVLTLGARVDRWIALHPEEQGAITAFLERAVERAAERGGDQLRVGVGVSGDGALAGTGPAVALRSLGTATMTSLFPGLHDLEGGDALPSPAAAAQVLDAIEAVDPGRPVALVEVGYPSADLLGGSEDAQEVFFRSLFGALDTRRASFPVVVVSRLHDLEGAACEAEGAELGEEDELVLAYRCSTGVRSSVDTPKRAWTSVLAGAARLASGGTGPMP